MSENTTTVQTPERKPESKPCYFIAVRTVGGQEYNVALIMKARIESKNINIPAIVVLPRLKGLVFAETPFPHIVQNVIAGIKHCKGILRGKVLADELLKVVYKPIEIRVGDIVEIVSGPFRGSKGRVTDIDLEEDRVTIEILDAASPMPITLRIKDVRVIERKQGEQ
jgi:transcriptional antiterminator NusG